MLKKIKNNLKVEHKLWLIMFISATLVVAALKINEIKTLKSNIERLSIQETRNAVFDMDLELNKKLSVAYNNALLIASNKNVKNAIINRDREALQKELDDIKSYMNKIGKENDFKVHVHNPDNSSFLRSWKKKHGDSIKAFRFGVQKVIDQHKAIKILELGRTGLAIRGITPIFDKNNKYVGSLEFIKSFKEVVKDYQRRDMGYLLLLNKYSQSISIKAKKYRQMKDGLVLGDKESVFDKNLIERVEKLNFSQLEKRGWILDDKYLYSLSKVFDMDGKELGYQLLATPKTKFDNDLQVLKEESNKHLMILLAIMLLMAVIITIAIRVSVIRPVKRLNNVMNKVSREGKFSLRIQTNDSKDEINEMSKAFNNLIANTRLVLKETSKAVEAIKDGDFSKRIKVNVRGDLAKLKDNVNSSAMTIESTMEGIKEVLDALSSSDFKRELNVKNVDAKGNFKYILDSATKTMSTLDEAVSLINDTVEEMAHSNFDVKINKELSGELEVLRLNINVANDTLKNGFDSFIDSISNLINGDLTVKVEGEYNGELQKLQDVINQSLENISNIFKDIKDTSLYVMDRVKGVEEDNKELNIRTQSQAASLEETAASMEEINATVQNSLDTALDANSLSEDALKVAEEGKDVMHETKASMEGIESASSKIAEITSLIDDIAFQTNILALNASVEAARAGEQGKGFAVVADEVRELSQKTSEAAKNIGELIDNTTKQINIGTEYTTRSAEMLEKINASSREVSEKIKSISIAAEEQSSGIDQVNQAIAQLDGVTQKNAILVDTLATDSEDIAKQISKLVSLINSFKM